MVAIRALPPVREYNTTVEDTKLVVVQSCGSRPEAELAKGALEEAGIPAIIQGDTAGGMREHLAWSGAGFKILVREDDATAARDVFTSLTAGDESSEADSEADR
jgi:F420-dependent methylenetetrahydromethanopterin dehydrogenase